MASFSRQNYLQAASVTGMLNCIALVFLILASVLPLFVLTSVEGDYNIAEQHLWIDFHLGQGIFQRNVCYGKDRPDEDVLSKFGLSCKGRSQLRGCSSSPEERDPKYARHHCRDFRFMQGMEILAIIACFFAMFFATRTLQACCADKPPVQWVERFGAALVTLIALAASSAVIGRVQKSDLVKFVNKEEKWECRMVLGTEICHGYGASYYLQALAVGLLAFALVGNLIMVAAAGERRVSSERDEPLMRGGAHDAA